MLKTTIGLVFLIAATLAGPLAADPLNPPEGRVLLRISGQIQNINGDGEALLDRAMLEALDWREIETHTSFTDGVQRFAGPTLASVMAAVGAEGGSMIAHALNEYHVEIDLAEAANHDVILALDHDGEPMRVRSRGPIWIVYPQDADEARLQRFDREMIWQLAKLEFKP